MLGRKRKQGRPRVRGLFILTGKLEMEPWEESPGEGEEVSCVDSSEEPREQQGQRPRGGSLYDRSEEPPGGQCGWSRHSEAEDPGAERKVEKWGWGDQVGPPSPCGGQQISFWVRKGASGGSWGSRVTIHEQHSGCHVVHRKTKYSPRWGTWIN